MALLVKLGLAVGLALAALAGALVLFGGFYIGAFGWRALRAVWPTPSPRPGKPPRRATTKE